MSKKDPTQDKTYLIKTKFGYIVAVEGKEEWHLDRRKPKDLETIHELERLIEIRALAGVEISELLKKTFGLRTVSHAFATHTTGAGDYDEQKPTKKRKTE